MKHSKPLLGPNTAASKCTHQVVQTTFVMYSWIKPLLIPVKLALLAALIYSVYIVSQVGYIYWNEERAVSSCDDRMYAVDVVPNFLRQEAFEALRKDMVNMVYKSIEHQKNQLEQTLFKNSAGVVFKFNADGADILLGHKDFLQFAPYFRTIVDDDSNAFVANVLIVNGTKPESTDASKPSIGTHVDDTVGIEQVDGLDFLAYRVNVIYLQVPDDMQGGQIVTEVNSHTAAQARVKPAENMLIRFRGDQLHNVQTFYSPTDQQRISLVVEEYKLPQEYYGLSIPMCVDTNCISMKESVEHRSVVFEQLLYGNTTGLSFHA